MKKSNSIEHSSLLILSLLSKEDMYGYQMISELEKLSENVFQMKEGTLYPVLKKLENGGQVTSYSAEFSGRTRKYYHLTQKGFDTLSAESREWQTYSEGINAVLDGVGVFA